MSQIFQSIFVSKKGAILTIQIVQSMSAAAIIFIDAILFAKNRSTLDSNTQMIEIISFYSANTNAMARENSERASAEILQNVVSNSGFFRTSCIQTFLTNKNHSVAYTHASAIQIHHCANPGKYSPQKK